MSLPRPDLRVDEGEHVGRQDFISAENATRPRRTEFAVEIALSAFEHANCSGDRRILGYGDEMPIVRILRLKCAGDRGLCIIETF